MEIYKFLEVIESECTHMYRAPEMLDRWQGYNVDGTLTDIWMLGCVLYVLCTGTKHPFQDAQNLTILNAQYSMSESGNNLADLHPISPLKDLIRALLLPDPSKRLTLAQVRHIIDKIQREEDVTIELCEEAAEIKKKQLLAIQRADPAKYDQMMDAMVTQSFISEEKQTPLTLNRIREADKQSSELILGFPDRNNDKPLQRSKQLEELPTSVYKLDIFDQALQFDDSPETGLVGVIEEENQQEAGEEWYTGWDGEAEALQEETKDDKMQVEEQTNSDVGSVEIAVADNRLDPSPTKSILI